MPDSELIVSDTSPLLNLALIDRLDLLETQFSAITENSRRKPRPFRAGMKPTNSIQLPTMV